MSQQFNRRIEVHVIGQTDTLLINKDLDVSFTCSKDRSSTPNELTLNILNLSEGSRKFIKANGNLEIYTGYGEQRDLLARVEVQKTITRYAPPNTVTEITCMDGLSALRDREISLSFKGGATVAQAVAKIVAQMGLVARQVDIDLNVPMKAGYTHQGKASAALDDVLSIVKGVWGIVNNVLIITTRGRGIGEPVLKISPQNGLIGQPALTEDTFTYERPLIPKKVKASTTGSKASLKYKRGDDDNVHKSVAVGGDTESVQEVAEGVEFDMLLRANVNPFDKIEIESRFVNGIYVVDKVDHAGATRDGDNITRVTAYKEASA